MLNCFFFCDYNYQITMNGRLNKVVMTGKIMKMKTGLYEKTWYPEWDDRQRGAANRILTIVLEVLDEYWE